ncbi:hypothetical protein QJQ45_020277, partial [Haematococcus lacustris]
MPIAMQHSSVAMHSRSSHAMGLLLRTTPCAAAAKVSPASSRSVAAYGGCVDGSTAHPEQATAAAAAAAGARPLKVVGMGSCGVDYLASVAAFPKPDEKLRTDRLEVQGGGNAANALTAAARLGLQPLLVSKIGGDGLGDSILEELEGEGIDTRQVLRAAGSPSPFTYIIVDRQ